MPTDDGHESGPDATEPRPGSDQPASGADLDALQADVRALEETLAELRDELDGSRTSSLLPAPSFRDLRWFTTEVSIPMTVLVLEANVRALRILQRALRSAPESGKATDSGVQDSAVGRRAADASVRALGRLDGALADLRSSAGAAGAGDGGNVTDLLDEAERLRERVRTELDRMEATRSRGREDWATASDPGDTPFHQEDAVAIDVEAELDSIRDQVEDENDEDGQDGDGDEDGDNGEDDEGGEGSEGSEDGEGGEDGY